MLASELVAEIQARVTADYECPDAPGFRDSLAARRDVAALLSDRDEMQAEIEGLQACLENEHACGIGFEEKAGKYKAEIERWKEEARQYCQNAYYWREQSEAKQAKIERLREVGDAFLRLVALYEEGQEAEYRPKWVRSALVSLEGEATCRET